MEKHHTHRPATRRSVPFTGPVRVRNQRTVAHGGVCEIATCRCGATRRTNVNGIFHERGPWVPVGDGSGVEVKP